MCDEYGYQRGSFRRDRGCPSGAFEARDARLRHALRDGELLAGIVRLLNTALKHATSKDSGGTYDGGLLELRELILTNYASARTGFRRTIRELTARSSALLLVADRHRQIPTVRDRDRQVVGVDRGRIV